ncbi:MAG: ABC transporter ATP-binding protein [Clostridia bacterium]
MLKIENVTKSYAKSATVAVKDISLEVKRGEIFGFLGPNGAGKSTTIKMATGILKIDKGDIYIDGKSIKTNPIEAKMEMGYVSDNHAVYDKLTGWEYLSFICSVYKVEKAVGVERSERYAEMFGLTEALSSQIMTYSHGMKQKIAIIAAVIHNPKLLILDEPLTGLDPQSAYDLKKLMRAHADEGNTVFFSSHVIDVVEKICDRVGIIKEGKLVMVGSLEDIKSRDKDKSLEQIFLELTSRPTMEADFFNE